MPINQFFLPYRPAYDAAGISVPGAKLYFTEAGGTNTPKPIYEDEALTIALENPVVADGAGQFVPIYLQDDEYRVRIYGRNAEVGVDTPYEEYDPYIPGALVGTVLATESTVVATRAELAALTGALSSTVYLTEAGREGTFIYSTANLATKVTADTAQGIYVPPATDTTGASGAWVRKFSGPLNVMWFGAVADDATDAATAINAAFRVAEALSVTGSTNGTIYRGGPSVLIPTGKYYCSAPLEPLATIAVRGEGGLGWGAATQIRFAAGISAWRAQAYNTSGVSTVDGPHFSGDALVIEDIYHLGGFAGTEGEFHGFHAKRAVHLTRCVFDGFQGDGFYANTNAGAGAPTEGNTNVTRITNCVFANCRNGIFLKGGDANADWISGCSFIGNRRWGVWDESFLGNHYAGHHFDSNGRTAYNDGTAGKSCSYVSQGGNQYFAIHGQETGASTNAPTGTTADNTWWGYWQAGGASAGSGVPAWSSGLSIRSGGPMLFNGVNNVSTVSHTHVESNGVSQFDQQCMPIGAGIGAAFSVTGGTLFRNRLRNWRAANLGMTCDGNVVVAGAFTASETCSLGPLTILTASGGISELRFGSATTELFNVNNDLYATGTNLYLRSGSNTILSIGAAGADIASGKNLSYAGTAVLTGGILTAAAHPALTGDITTSAGSLATTLAAATVVAKIAGQALAPASVAATGAITSSGAAAGIGYATGAGGQVTQATSKATATSALNKTTGDITLNAAALAANTVVSFDFANSSIAANDELRLWVKSGEATPGSYLVTTSGNGAGTRKVCVRNMTAGSLSEAVVVGFAVGKSVVA